MGGHRRAVATLALLLIGLESGQAQVVAEPALLTAGVPTSETFLPYVAFPNNAIVLGGMIRFPLQDDVDLGARAGLWLRDNSDDTPFAGGDLRYGLYSRELAPGGGLFNLAFDLGVGVSEPGVTVWKFPVGFIAGIGFQLAGSDSEIFTHPRVELGVSSGDDSSDSALLLDLGGVFAVTPQIAAVLDLRFGNGVFEEGDNVVIALGALWRL